MVRCKSSVVECSRDSLPLVVSVCLLTIRSHPADDCAKDLLASSATGSARRLCHFWFESLTAQNALNVRDFIAVASLLCKKCRNSPPDCFSVAEFYSAPIPGSTPLFQYKKHLLLQVLSILVEARGVEPLSENLFTQLSTSVVCL